MSLNFLDFEQPIAELEAKIEELQLVNQGQDLNLDLEAEIAQLRTKSEEKTKKVFSDLDPWQVCRIARHPGRPYTQDYIDLMFTDFNELAGDRAYANDEALIRGTTEKVRRNFAMPRPEGYRKALRIMEMAERFKMPIITFIDTPGAYPGIGAEERGQSEAIARNLKVMARLTVPIVCTVIGEGGSGGALAIGVGDKVNMLEYSTYSVISPEGCASILWKTAEKASTAAEAMGVTAPRIKELGLIDDIVDEPLGGAHRDFEMMANSLKQKIKADLVSLEGQKGDELIENRYQRLMTYGYC